LFAWLTGKGKIARSARVSFGRADPGLRRIVPGPPSRRRRRSWAASRHPSTTIAIPESEVQKAMVVSALAPGRTRSAEAFRARVLDALIDQHLEYEDAVRFGPPPPNAAEIADAMKKLEDRLRAEGKDPRAEFAKAGLTPEDVRASHRPAARDPEISARSASRPWRTRTRSRRARSTKSACVPETQASGQPVPPFEEVAEAMRQRYSGARLRRGSREVAEGPTPEVADLDLSDSSGHPDRSHPGGRFARSGLRRRRREQRLPRPDHRHHREARMPVMISAVTRGRLGILLATLGAAASLALAEPGSPPYAERDVPRPDARRRRSSRRTCWRPPVRVDSRRSCTGRPTTASAPKRTRSLPRRCPEATPSSCRTCGAATARKETSFPTRTRAGTATTRSSGRPPSPGPRETSGRSACPIPARCSGSRPSSHRRT
jgi:hypothetical protein